MNTDETRSGELNPEQQPEKLLHREITEALIGSAFEVHSLLGFGFLEKVYQRALQVELLRRGHRAELEKAIAVKYKGVVVGEYFADVLVDDCVIVEVKVATEYQRADEAQLLNELKATGIRVGLLINFGRRQMQFRRFVF